MSSDEAAPIIVPTEVEVVEDYTGTGGQSDPMTKYILDATTIYGTRVKSVFYNHTEAGAIQTAKAWLAKCAEGCREVTLHNANDALVWGIAAGKELGMIL